jgi:CTP synthase (UTP-ammonia lyase)
VKVNIEWIDSSQLEPLVKEKNPSAYAAAWKTLETVQGILVPGGFGDRGVLGKVLAIQYAREKKIPFFGICLGFQVSAGGESVIRWLLQNASDQEFLKNLILLASIFPLDRCDRVRAQRRRSDRGNQR